MPNLIMFEIFELVINHHSYKYNDVEYIIIIIIIISTFL